MSYYEDERQRRRPTRETSRREDYYDDDDYYNSRGNTRTTALVKRRNSYDDVEEEITREFSPPGARGGYIRETTVRKSGVRPARRSSYEDDRYTDDRYDEEAYAAARRREGYHDRRDRSRRRRDSSAYSSRSRSRSRTPPKDHRKSKVEETLESLGLGGLIGGILGKESKDSKRRSPSRDRHRSKSRSGRSRAQSETRSTRQRSRSRGGPSREQVTQAIKAALLAGAGEAFRTRKEPGGFSGEKGKRILTAAIAATTVDGVVNHGKDPESHRKRDTIGSAIAGLATSRIAYGPRSKSRGRNGSRSPDGRGRSQSRGGVGDLLAGGAVAAAAKKVYDNVRSRSRGRSGSPRSRGSRSPSPARKEGRSRSVSRAAARALSAIGLKKAADTKDPDRERRKPRRRNSDDYDDRSDYYDDYRDDVGQPRSGAMNGRARSVSQSRSDWQVDQYRGATPGAYSLDYGPHHNGDPDTDSDSDLGSSSGEEKDRKKGKRKLLLTAGLASIATIHAGHSMYQSYEKRHARHVAVKEGRVSPEMARQNQNKDRLQDAASIGIAALGVKGAYSEWKEMKEHKEEFDEELEKVKRHREKREARRHKAEKLKRLEKQHYLDSGYTSSMPNLQSPPPMYPPPGGWHQPFPQSSPSIDTGPHASGGLQPQAPHYFDGNPYAYSTGQLAGSPLPHPPVGGDHFPPPPSTRAPRERSPSRGRPV